MTTYQELVATRQRVVSERDALVAQADDLLSAEDYGAAEEEAVGTLKAQIERQGARIALIDGQIASALSAPVITPLSEPDPERRTPITTRPAHGRGGLYGSLGEQALDVVRAATNRDPDARERLVYSLAKSLEEQGIQAALGQNTIMDSEGGFLVQTDVSASIWQRMVTGGAILSRIATLPLTPPANAIDLPGVDETSRATGSRWGGIRGYWVEEAGTITASAQKYFKVSLKLKKVAALTYASEEMLAHVSLMNTLLTDGMADELRFLIEDAIYEGDGAGKPMGILNAPAVVSIAKETGQTAATIVHNNLKKMWARLHAASRSNAVWFINQDCEPTLDDLTKVIGTAGIEPNYVTYGPDGVLRIKGRPVVAVEYAPTAGTVGDIVLVDLSQYLFITSALQQAASIHFKFDTDEQAFRATVRVDGALRWKSALTPFKGSNTQSPVITLATRA